jgi:hypothetical protein
VKKNNSAMIFDSDGILKSGGLLPHKVYVSGRKDVSGDGPKSPIPARFVQGGRTESKKRK